MVDLCCGVTVWRNYFGLRRRFAQVFWEGLFIELIRTWDFALLAAQIHSAKPQPTLQVLLRAE